MGFAIFPLASTPVVHAESGFGDLFDVFDLNAAAPGPADGTWPDLDVTWTETFSQFWVGLNGAGGMHAHLQDFINDNTWWLNPINAVFAVDGHCGLICNGADSSPIIDADNMLTGATAAQHGGWFFGDGGDGAFGQAGGSGGMRG
ncbi:hypothetical protein ACT18_24550, partial [Mycolicibacter kumamotonensis]